MHALIEALAALLGAIGLLLLLAGTALRLYA